YSPLLPRPTTPTLFPYTTLFRSRGDLYLQTVLRDQDDAELRAHGDALRKQAGDFDRRRVRGHVVIGWLASQKQVAHTPADQQRLVFVAFEHLANRIGQCPARHTTRQSISNVPLQHPSP